MRQTRVMMGMPITIEIVGVPKDTTIFETIFAYFGYVDETFSTYKPTSEISQINQGRLRVSDASHDMQMIFALAERTQRETDGFFSIEHQGVYDPSGLVKGWAIYNAALLLWKAGYTDFFVDAGGDIQA